MTIEEIIQKQIGHMDLESMVKHEIADIIRPNVKRDYQDVTKEEIRKIIKTEIDIAMSKGVKTDDGWGKRDSYSSFEEMFKKYFKEALDNKWDIQKLVSDFMKSEVKKLVDDKTQDIVNKLKTSLNS